MFLVVVQLSLVLAFQPFLLAFQIPVFVLNVGFC